MERYERDRGDAFESSQCEESERDGEESFDSGLRTASRRVQGFPTQSHEVVRRRPAAPTRVPAVQTKPVSLDDHYTRVYNAYMNAKFPDESDEEESARVVELADGEEHEGEGEWEECSDDYDATMSRAVGNQPATRKRRRPPESEATTGPLVKRRRPYDTRTRTECFLCAWGNLFHDGLLAPHINGLYNIINSHSEKSNEEIAQAMHLYYKKFVHQPGRGMEMLTKRVALEHIEQLHTNSARIYIGERMKQYKKMLFSFEQSLYRDDGCVDNQTLKNILLVDDKIYRLYFSDIGKMNFNFGQTKEDLKLLGKPINTMPMLKQRVERECRSQKVQQRLRQTQREEFSV